MKKLLLLLVIWLPLYVVGQPGNYKIYDVKNSKIITAGDLVKELKNIDVVFFWGRAQ